MQLNLKGMAIAFAIVWGAAVFLCGLAHLIWPSYAGTFLDVIASIYPGYHAGGFGEIVIGTSYAVVDGAAWGLVVAWLYNRFAKPMPPRP
ncbi:MAG TPA: hypothetical protein VGH98_08970 [Gemmatimonadaceae bacterium]|jgi:hypothetical protein